MTDEHDEMPSDPLVQEGHPFEMLERARLLRRALLDARDLNAVFEMLGALSDDECRLICLETAMDAWYERRYGGEGTGA